MNDSPATTRWRSAQKLELAFWKEWTTLPPYRNLDLAAYWREAVSHFGIDGSFFAGRRVLDVGCGPFGLIHYLDNAAERIRMDPLLVQYVDKPALTGPQLSVAAMSESLPLGDASVDIVICYNALDHMMDMHVALDEIARVMRPGGSALLMIHTFPGWLRPFFAIDRMHVHHHTAASFAALVGKHFRIDHADTVRRTFKAPSMKDWLTPTGIATAWKYLAGSMVMSSTSLRVSPR